MATPNMRARHPAEKSDNDAASVSGRRRAALRLLAAERSEEIFPVLLEEIIALGFSRALVAEADFEAGELGTAASLNFPKTFQERFKLSLWADSPIIETLHRAQSAVVPYVKGNSRKLYLQP